MVARQFVFDSKIRTYWAKTISDVSVELRAFHHSRQFIFDGRQNCFKHFCHSRITQLFVSIESGAFYFIRHFDGRHIICRRSVFSREFGLVDVPVEVPGLDPVALGAVGQSRRALYMEDGETL